MKYLQPQFWNRALNLAIKSASQSALAVLGSNSIGLLQTDWVGVCSATIMGFVFSVLTSIATTK